MPTLRATREGRHSGCSAPAPFCSSVSFANASSSLPSRDAQGRAKSLALSPCDSRTHLTPLLQWPARGCLHPLLSGANGWWPPGAGRGEYTQFRLFAPLPLPPAREAAKNSLCLVERAGRGRKANSTLVIPPASPRPAAPSSLIGREERRRAHLRPHTWGVKNVSRAYPRTTHWIWGKREDNYSSSGLCPKACHSHRPTRQGLYVCPKPLY